MEVSGRGVHGSTRVNQGRVPPVDQLVITCASTRFVNRSPSGTHPRVRRNTASASRSGDGFRHSQQTRAGPLNNSRGRALASGMRHRSGAPVLARLLLVPALHPGSASASQRSLAERRLDEAFGQ